MSKYGVPLIVDDNDLEQELLIPAKNIVMDDEITTLSDKMADLALDVATAEGKAVNVSNNLNTIQSGLATNTSNISTLQTTVNGLVTRMTAAESDIEDLTNVTETPLPIATEDQLGVVKVGTGLAVKPDGTLYNNYEIADDYDNIPVANNRGEKGLARLGNGLIYDIATDAIQVNVEELEIPEYSTVTTEKNGLMTPAMLTTLNNLQEAQQGTFSHLNFKPDEFTWDSQQRLISLKLSTATETEAGTVKVGDGLSVTGDGTLSVTKKLEPASKSNLGGVLIGDRIEVNEDGVISVPMATQDGPGMISAIDKIKLDNIPLQDYTGPAAVAKVDLTGFLVAEDNPSEPGTITPMVLEDSDDRAHQSVKVPAATTSNLGAIVVGEGLSITEGGVLSVTNVSSGSGTTEPASKIKAGIVKIGDGIDVNEYGTISISNASSVKSGLMTATDKYKLDQLSAVQEYSLPKATAYTLGGIKVGTGLTSDVDGTVSVHLLEATKTSSGLMSAEDKDKLDKLDTLQGGGSGGTSDYELPMATSSTLGGIKLGTGLMSSSDGTVSVDLNEASTVTSGLMSVADKRKLNSLENYTLATATEETLGGIKIGSGLGINSDGKVSVDIPIATTLSGGNGLMSYEDKRALATLQAASGGDNTYTLFPATASELGGIKVGSGLSITGDGVLSATITGGTTDTVTSSQNGLATPQMLAAVNSYNSIKDDIVLGNDLATVTVGSANSVNGYSVNVDVPANAKFTDTTYDLANNTTSGLMSKELYQSLEDLKNNTAGYISGAATADSLGGIKVGSGLSIDRGVLSVNPQIANDTTLGSVKIGEGISVTNDGTISVPVASTTHDGLLTAREKAKLATIPDTGYEGGVTASTSIDLTGFLVAGTSTDPDDPIDIQELEEDDARAHPTITLPVATKSDPGIIIVGQGLDIDTQTGVLSAVVTEGGTSSPATKSSAGIVQIGDGISVNNGIISVPEADAFGSGLMTSTDKQKLDSLNNYTLPTASSSVVGGIKLGAGLSMDTLTSAVSVSLDNATTITDGLMSAADKVKLEDLSQKPDYSLPEATADRLGGVKVGTGLNVSGGLLSVPTASTTQDGLISKEDLVKLRSINLNDSSSSSSFVTTELSFVDFMVAHSIEGSEAIEPYIISEDDPYAHVSLTVPNATKDRLGVVRAGSGIDIDTQTGVISVAESIQSGSGATNYTAATTTELGVVKVGSGLSIASDGTLSANVPTATTATAGLMSATDKSKLDNLTSTTTATGTLALEGFLYVDTTDSTQYQENSDGTVTINPVIRDASDTPVTVNIPISTMPTATTTQNGLMSSSDKAKVENTNAVLRIQTTQPSISLGDNIVWIDPVNKTVKVYNNSSWYTII